jgi:hypothetical protein
MKKRKWDKAADAALADMGAPAYKLVRKLEDGKITERKRGRLPPLSENGFILGDDESTYKAGDPPKPKGRRRKGGRPKGSKNKVKPAKIAYSVGKKRGRPKGSGKAASADLSGINAIVQAEIRNRLLKAKAAALAAFDKALSV